MLRVTSWAGPKPGPQLRPGSGSSWTSPWAAPARGPPCDPGPATTAFAQAAERGPGLLHPVSEEHQGLGPRPLAQIHQDRGWAGDRWGSRFGGWEGGGRRLGLGQAAEEGASGCLWGLGRLLGNSKAWKRRGRCERRGLRTTGLAWAVGRGWGLGSPSRKRPLPLTVTQVSHGHRGHHSVYNLHGITW